MALPLRRLSLIGLALAAISCGDGGDAPAPEPEPDVREFAARDYCDCMFLKCHDLYHELWEEDEVVARQACLHEAEATPVNGGETQSGDFIECRLHFCEDELVRDCATAGARNDVCR